MWIPNQVGLDTPAGALDGICQSNQTKRSCWTNWRMRSSPLPSRGRMIQAMAVRKDRTKEAPTAAMPTSEPL